jgi:hypothetical protein
MYALLDDLIAEANFRVHEITLERITPRPAFFQHVLPGDTASSFPSHYNIQTLAVEYLEGSEEASHLSVLTFYHQLPFIPQGTEIIARIPLYDVEAKDDHYVFRSKKALQRGRESAIEIILPDGKSVKSDTYVHYLLKK